MLRILMDLLPTLEDGFFSRYGPNTATRIKETLSSNKPLSTQQILEHLYTCTGSNVLLHRWVSNMVLTAPKCF